MENPSQKVPMIRNKERSEQQVMACLPICIIFNILSRLPAEVILICRCVCKSWYALTHESSFISKQLEWSKHHESSRYMLQGPVGDDIQNLSLLDMGKKIITELSFNKIRLTMLTYQVNYKLSNYCIVCSSNGLLCLRPKDKLDGVVICNPMTRDCLILPSMTKTGALNIGVSYQLGFHFDNSSGKYKVIREFQISNKKPSKFQLITVGENSWKDLSPPNSEVEQGYDAAIFWNDGFHWKISENHCRKANNCILGFDLIEEKFYTISFPKSYKGICYYPHTYQLVGLGDDLKIVEYDLSCFMRIWKVIGNKVEGFSMLLQYTYVLSVPPSKMWQQEMISETDKETYLIQVSTWRPGVNKCTLEIFSPTMQLHHELDIVGLPLLFKIISFKPSLVSPLTIF